MTKDPPSGLWQPRSVSQTLKLYADWADSYDADVSAWGYATPGRIASALAAHLPDLGAPILDFGCGTGVSGAALSAQGFTCIDGTDVAPQMIEKANARGIYRKTWISAPGQLDIAPSDYRAITAIGVISAGAAPPETLDLVLGAMAPGTLLTLSYNDATLDDPAYTSRLEGHLDRKTAHLLFCEHGPHLPQKNMNSTIYIIEKA